MKRFALSLLLVPLASCSSFQRSTQEPLAEFLIGDWNLARIQEPGQYALTGIVPTRFAGDGTWTQYPAHCGSEALDEARLLAGFTLEQREAHLRAARESRRAQQWRIRGRELRLVVENGGVEKVVATYTISDYGYGPTALCRHCEDSPGPRQAYLAVAGNRGTLASLWYRTRQP